MYTTVMAKNKNAKWFKKIRGSYLPVSWQGWLLYVPYIFWLVLSLNFTHQAYSSVGDMLIMLVPYWLSGVVIMQWVGLQKS